MNGIDCEEADRCRVQAGDPHGPGCSPEHEQKGAEEFDREKRNEGSVSN